MKRRFSFLCIICDFCTTGENPAAELWLKPDYGDAFYSRGFVRHAKGDLDGALQDHAWALNYRGIGRCKKLDLEGTAGLLQEAF